MTYSIEDLDRRAKLATPGPWKLTFFKGATECGHPLECDWEAIASQEAIPIELENPHGKDTDFAVALVNSYAEIRRDLELMRATEKVAARYKYLQNIPVADAQAFFWNYSSRRQRSEAIDAAIARLARGKEST